MFYIIDWNNTWLMVDLAFNSISQEWGLRTSSISSWTWQEEFHIYARSNIILVMYQCLWYSVRIVSVYWGMHYFFKCFPGVIVEVWNVDVVYRYVSTAFARHCTKMYPMAFMNLRQNQNRFCLQRFHTCGPPVPNPILVLTSSQLFALLVTKPILALGALNSQKDFTR